MRYVPGFFLLALLIFGYAEFFHVREASADSPTRLTSPVPVRAALIVEENSSSATSSATVAATSR